MGYFNFETIEPVRDWKTEYYKGHKIEFLSDDVGMWVRIDNNPKQVHKYSLNMTKKDIMIRVKKLIDKK